VSPKTIMTRKALGVIAAVGAGIALWRFTSGDWLGGVVLTLAVAAIAAWYLLSGRIRTGGRRY
jgi:hypothetical protein